MILRVRFPVSALGVALSALLLVSAACRNENRNDTVELPSDEEIMATVRAQLESAQDVPVESIDVSTQKGVTTLSGTTDNLLAKKRATEISESVRGVLSVVNNVKVASDRPDKAVDRDIERAIRSAPAVDRLDIATTVNNGLVTMKGSVASWQERRLAESVVHRG